MKISPAWTPCDCGEFYCNIHQQHASECDCPPIDEWDTDPYSEPIMKPASSKDRQAAFKQRQLDKGYVRRGIYATPSEHEQIKVYLAEIRKLTQT